MAIPLKTGADLYNNELLRARLHNHPADALDEYGVGSFYFNNSSGLNSSDRMRYRGLTAWHSVANLEDINRLEELISALSGSSSESVASVLGRVITLEGYFSNGKAKDADLLDGHNSDYFAEAATLNDLLEDYEAFKAVFSDNSDDYINTWTEVKAFLDGIKNTEDLNAILLGINTELGKKADKATTLAGYGITDAAKYYGTYSVDSARYGVGYDNMSQGSVDLPVAGGGFIAATQGKYGFQIVGGYSSAGHMFWRRVENDTFGTWRKVLDDNNYSDLITNLNKNLNVPSITIGGIKLSVVDGQLQIDGDAFATGQLASGGIGSEGSGSGASGIVILEDWEKYDDTLAQVLGAGLGVGLRDKIAALESKATKVSVSGLLESGKSIGTIKVDDTSYNLLAPDDYLPLSGGTISGTLTIQSGDDGKLIFDNTDTETYWSLIYFKQNGETYGRFGTQGTTDLSWNSNLILHSGNYASVLDNAYLKLSGGTLTDSVMVNHSSGSKGYLLLTNGASIGGLVTNGTAVELFNVNGYGIGVEGTSDVYVLTNWAKKTMLHSGNIRDYAFTPQTPIVNNTDADTLLTNGVYLNATGNGSGNSNFPSTYGILMTFTQDKNYSAQISVGNGSMHVRRKIDAWSDWKTLAFTDSNVASATKLQTARSLWGNSFDGTADVNGDIRLPNYKALQSYTVGGTLRNLVVLNTADNLDIGDANYDTNLIGNKLIFKTGSWKTAMVINSSGNVTIGESDLASTTHKLHVNGTMRVQCINIDGSNEINAVDNSGSPLALCLNWSSTGNVILAQGGGNVGIGTTNAPYKFNVGGQIHATGQIYSDIGFVLRTTDGKGTRASLSHSSNTIYIQSGYNDGSSTAGNMMISGVNTANLASLDVKANKSTFNGRLFVNGATDDGTTALQISGDGTLGHGIKISNGWSSASYGSYRTGFYARTGGWANGFYQYSSSGDILGGLEFAGRNEDLHLIRFLHGANAILDLSNNEATINGDLKVTGNIIADGQVSSGGVAEAGTGGATGGSGLDRVPFTIPANTTSFTCEHNLGTREISVSIYEDGNDFQQVLADVYLDSTNVARIVFGAATDVVHKVVIIG